MTVKVIEPVCMRASALPLFSNNADVMEYRIDDDNKGFHVWMSDDECEKLKRDAEGCDVDLEEYIGEMVLDAVSVAVKSGLQPRKGEQHLTVTATVRR